MARHLNDVNLEAIGSLVEKIRAQPDAAKTQWRSEVKWTGAFRSEARSRDLAALPSDEPSGFGGSDTAANPVEQVLAALGNCLAVGYAANASVAGLEVVMNRCMKIEHARLFGGLGFVGVYTGVISSKRPRWLPS